MKKTVLNFCMLLLAFSATGVLAQSQKGNGNVIAKERQVSNFINVSVGDGIDLFISQANNFKLIVKTDENLHDLIKTEVSDNHLRISVNGNIRESKQLDVFLTVPDLESLKVSDGSDVESETTLKFDNFNVDCSDGSDIDLKLETLQFSCKLSDGSDAEIEGNISKMHIKADDGSDVEARVICDEIVCEINEGSDLDLEGEAKYVSIEANQGSDINSFNLKVEDYSLKLYEGSDAFLFVTNNLDITAKGGSDVIVKGNPANRNIKVDDDSELSFR